MTEPVEKNDETKPISQDGFRREYAYKRPWYAIPLGSLGTLFFLYSGIGNIVGAFLVDDIPLTFFLRLFILFFGLAFMSLGWLTLRDTFRLYQDRKKSLRIILTPTSVSMPQAPMQSGYFEVACDQIRWIRLINWYGKKTLKIRAGKQKAVIPDAVLTSRDLIESLATDLAEASGVGVERREYRRGQFSLRTILIVMTAVAVTLGMTAYCIADSSGTRLLALWGMMLVIWSPILVFGWAFAFGRRPLRRVFAVGYAVGMAVELAGQSHYFSHAMAQQTWPPRGWCPILLPLLRYFSPPITPANFPKSLDVDIGCSFIALVISGLLFGLMALFMWWLVHRWRQRRVAGTLNHRAEVLTDKAK